MEYINPEVQGLIDTAIDNQQRANITWAEAAKANEAAKGRWQVTVHCLQEAGLTLTDFRLAAAVPPATAQRWMEGLVTTIEPQLRQAVFEALLAAVVQDRARLEQNHTLSMTPYTRRKAG